MNGLTIADTWTDYRHHVVGLGVPDEHLWDIRASFYAGAIAMIETVNALAKVGDPLLGALVFECLHAEKRAFLDEMHEAGKAHRPPATGKPQ